MKSNNLPTEETPRTDWEVMAGTISTLSLYMRISTDMQNRYVFLLKDMGKKAPKATNAAAVDTICSNAIDWIEHEEMLKRQKSLHPQVLDEWWYKHVGCLTPEGQKLKMDLYALPGQTIVQELYDTLMADKENTLKAAELYLGKEADAYKHVEELYRMTEKVMDEYRERFNGDNR